MAGDAVVEDTHGDVHKFIHTYRETVSKSDTLIMGRSQAGDRVLDTDEKCAKEGAF